MFHHHFPQPHDCLIRPLHLASGLCPWSLSFLSQTSLPSNLYVSVNFLQWKKGQSRKVDRNGDSKEIISLFPVHVILPEAVKMLEFFFPKIKVHVFVATHQYETLILRSDSVGLGDLLTIEDYTTVRAPPLPTIPPIPSHLLDIRLLSDSGTPPPSCQQRKAFQI